MLFKRQAIALLLLIPAWPQTRGDLAGLTSRLLVDLIRLDTTNPPGNETRVAEYLKKLCETEGIAAETLGEDPARRNFIARLHGGNRLPPLLLMAHSDVVPADRSQWTVDPFAGEVRDGLSTVGIQWLIANAWDKINAEFALNEGGFAKKIPTRVLLLAHGTAGHRPTALFCARKEWRCTARRCSCARTKKAARTTTTTASAWRAWAPARIC